jgi:hypothetical protein
MLLEALRAKLAEEEHTDSLSFDRLAEIAGTSKSTTHHRFPLSDQPQVVNFLCWLERLSPARRHAYIDTHCRHFPSLEHPLLAHAAAQTSRLRELLDQQRGLTLVTGGTAYSRAFVVTALGHSYRRLGGRRRAAAGIDLHLCSSLVPVESLIYVDGTADRHLIRQLALKVWPRILTSPAGLFLFHGLWSAAPELRKDIIRCARHKHVVLAEGALSDLTDLENQVPTSVHVLTVSEGGGVPAAIRVRCRRLKDLPKGRKTRVVGKKAVQDIGHFSPGAGKAIALNGTDAPL